MPFNSVGQYVKGLLDGLESPQYAPVKCHVSAKIPVPETVPLVNKGGTMRPVPLAYVWPNPAREDRQTMPRPLAWKKVVYSVQVILQAFESPDDPFRETAFPCLVDAVNAMLNTTVMPIFITDPVTGFLSQMLEIGEQIHTEMFIPDSVGMGGQAYLRASGRMDVTLKEAFNFTADAPV